MVQKNKKIGLIFPEINNWTGGINYLYSLISSLKFLKKKINFTIFTNKKICNFLVNYYGINRNNILVSSIFNKFSILKIISKILFLTTKKNIILNSLIKKKNINLISHFYHKGLNAEMVPWIPDLQHKILKKNFSKNEIFLRDKIIKNYIKNCKNIIVSSNKVKKDLNFFFDVKNNFVHVLNFIPELNFSCIKKKNHILKKYNISENYIYIPNQFWVHKNHQIIIKTAKLFKNHKIKIKFILSGNINDYRNKNYFKYLLNLIKKLNVENYFNILGEIPRNDLINLMFYADIIINPSKCEGWSTTVEEAKILNKKIILSDIDVHFEQKNKLTYFFNTNDEKNLFDKILMCLALDSEKTKKSIFYLKKKYYEKRKKFALKYYDICINKIK